MMITSNVSVSAAAVAPTSAADSLISTAAALLSAHTVLFLMAFA